MLDIMIPTPLQTGKQFRNSLAKHISYTCQLTDLQQNNSLYIMYIKYFCSKKQCVYIANLKSLNHMDVQLIACKEFVSSSCFSPF